MSTPPAARWLRPFVDRPVLDAEAARVAAAAALRGWGVTAGLSAMRVGMNALFAVEGEPAVVRVGRATAPALAAHQLVTTLLDAGIPTAAPIAGWASDVDGFAVTGWERVRETRQALRWEQVGEAVRAVHELAPAVVPPTFPMPSPVGFPWWDFESMLADVGGQLDTQARRGIESVIERAGDWGQAVAESPVVCHGDVHPGNVLTAARGPLLMDWDLLCFAAPVWDHAALLTWADRWGGDPSVYVRFAAGYGASFADDPLARSLGELRNVAATLLRLRAGRTDSSAAAEAERRLRFWRGDPDAPRWQAQ